MSNWFTRLFAPKGLVGQDVHAWYYGPYGRSHVIGEVVEETERELVLDVGELRAFRRVWKHDARLMSEDLPLDTNDLTEEKGT